MDALATPARRRVLFSLYYLCEGAPIGFLWWALPSLLRARGVAGPDIGDLLALLVLPWAFKWLWAPVIDRWQGPRFGLRGWIVAAQVGMVATLAPLLFIDPLARLDVLAVALVTHALCAATQDAAIDALMIRTTEPGERGRLSGWMQVGMLAGRSLLGGGALLVVGRFGEGALVATLLAVLVAGLALAATYRSPAPAPTDAGGAPLTELLRGALGRRTTWVGLAFAATAGAGFEGLGAFAGPILTDAADGVTDVAGRFFLVHAVVGAALGGLVAGRVTDRIGARWATVLAGVAVATAVAATALQLPDGPAAGSLVPWLTAVYVSIGAFTAASYALFMAWTDRRLAATQFSAYMGATNLCESWAAAAAGRGAAALGQAPTFGLLAGLGLAALALIPLAPRDSGART